MFLRSTSEEHGRAAERADRVTGLGRCAATQATAAAVAGGNSGRQKRQTLLRANFAQMRHCWRRKGQALTRRQNTTSKLCNGSGWPLLRRLETGWRKKIAYTAGAGRRATSRVQNWSRAEGRGVLAVRSGHVHTNTGILPGLGSGARQLAFAQDPSP